MLRPALLPFVSPKVTRHRRGGAARRSGHIRLHTERLEERFMMSANQQLAIGEAPVLPAVVEGTPLIASFDQAAGSQVAATPPAAANQTALTQFASTAEFDQWLINAAVAQWGSLFGQTTWSYGSIYPLYLADVVNFGVADADGVMAFTKAADSTAVSSTNLQVAGVDEADLVETDGNYLYLLSGRDLVIVKAGEGDDLRVTARVRLDGNAVGMYLWGDRLAIVSSTAESNQYGDSRLADVDVAFDYVRTFYAPKAPTTTVTIFDIADRTAPKLVQKMEMDGRLVSSRSVDGKLRLVISNDLDLPMPIARPIEPGQAPGAFEQLIAQPGQFLRAGIVGDFAGIDVWNGGWNVPSIYETQEEYIARIRGDVLAKLRPQIRSLAVDGSVIDESPLFAATDLYRPESLGERHVTTVATFDMAANEAGPTSTASVMSNGATTVYATADSVYVFAEKATYQSLPWSFAAYRSTKTDVWKFAIDRETQQVELAATGEFDGKLLNQFAADEQNGYLRVVTTTDSWAGGASLVVLQQVGQNFEQVGRIDQLAAGERLHSVRFLGSRAFVVTFRMVDPLFAIDLSDPAHPTVLGELKIPGVSGYLQPLDATHLLGVGRDVDPSGGMFSDLQLSIFDVSDMTHPEVVQQYSFTGGWSTNSPVLSQSWIPLTGDHHAAAYFADSQLFAMPVYSTGGGNLDGVMSTPVFRPGHGGLQIFRIDFDAGFMPAAFIEHETLVKRTVHIGDRLFAISSGQVSVHDLADPAVQLGQINIAAEVGGEPTELTQLSRFQPSIQTLSINPQNLGAESLTPRATRSLPAARRAAFVAFAVARTVDDHSAQLLAAEMAAGDSSQPGSRFMSAAFADAATDGNDSAASHLGLDEAESALARELVNASL